MQDVNKLANQTILKMGMKDPKALAVAATVTESIKIAQNITGKFIKH